MADSRNVRRGRLAVIAAAALVALLAWSGCAATLTPPTDVEDPVTVRLLRTARHSALLLPCPDGRTVEYGFGEWGWFAQNRESWWRAPRILFWPSEGTLARRHLAPAEVERLPSTEGARLAAFEASRTRVDELRQRLDREFEAGGEPHYDPQDRLAFVRHPRSFWIAYTCHDAVVEWAEELGCRASWAPLRLTLELAR